MKKVNINISIDPEVKAWAENQAKKNYLNLSTWINQLLNRLKKEQEREVKHDQSN
jgi:predicted HicB family RNase H-like nuclease